MMRRRARVLVAFGGLAAMLMDPGRARKPPTVHSDSASAPGPGVIRGTASYRERIALLPGAEFEAQLLDVSRLDAPALELAVVRVEAPAAPPIRFELSFDPSRIDERHVYVVRARITHGERLLFTTDTAYPVLTRRHGQEVQLLLVRAAHAPGR